MQCSVRAIVMVVWLLGLLPSWANAGDPATQCRSSKNKEAGKYSYCRQKIEAKFAVNGDAVSRAASLQKCVEKYDAKWPLLESKAAATGGTCPTIGDQVGIRDAVDAHTTYIANALIGVAGWNVDPPSAPLLAHEESGGAWVELGPADLSCLNTPPADVPTSIPIALNTITTDADGTTLVPSATIRAFRGFDLPNPFDVTTSDINGHASHSVPVGVTRFGFMTTAADAMTTFVLSQYISPNVTPQPVDSDTDPAKRLKIQSVSNASVAALVAAVGESRDPGRGITRGTLRDCQGRAVSNFVAVISSTKGTPGVPGVPTSLLSGASAYYFDANTDVAVPHDQQAAASGDGQFIIVDIPPKPVAYIQLWGFPHQAALEANELYMVAELGVVVIADSILITPLEPSRF